MFSLFITALAVFTLIGIGLYFWQKFAANNPEYTLPSPPVARGLFDDDTSIAKLEAQRLASAAAERDESLLARAKNGERVALLESYSNGDANLYDRVLVELVRSAASDAKLLSLMSYVTQNELPVNRALATAVIAAWKKSPDRAGTAKALHFAALSDDPELYRQTVEQAIELRREGKLADVLPADLRALFDGEFWILSSRTRSSGAGFVLKRTLESARRELEAAIVGSPPVRPAPRASTSRGVPNKGDQSKEGPP